jgi:hypothetical protein
MGANNTHLYCLLYFLHWKIISKNCGQRYVIASGRVMHLLRLSEARVCNWQLKTRDVSCSGAAASRKQFYTLPLMRWRRCATFMVSIEAHYIIHLNKHTTRLECRTLLISLSVRIIFYVIRRLEKVAFIKGDVRGD